MYLFSAAAAQENPKAVLAALETFDVYEEYLKGKQSKSIFLQFVGDPVEPLPEDAIDGNVSYFATSYLILQLKLETHEQCFSCRSLSAMILL